MNTKFYQPRYHGSPKVSRKCWPECRRIGTAILYWWEDTLALHTGNILALSHDVKDMCAPMTQ